MANFEELEKSIIFSTWKICSQIAETQNVKFTKEFVSTLGLLVFKEIGIMSEDLESFSRHAKRTVINADDVKLLVRRIPNLCEHIDEICQKNIKPRKKAEKRKKSVGTEVTEQEASPSTSKSKKHVKKKSTDKT